MKKYRKWWGIDFDWIANAGNSAAHGIPDRLRLMNHCSYIRAIDARKISIQIQILTSLPLFPSTWWAIHATWLLHLLLSLFDWISINLHWFGSFRSWVLDVCIYAVYVCAIFLKKLLKCWVSFAVWRLVTSVVLEGHSFQSNRTRYVHLFAIELQWFYSFPLDSDF